MPDAVALDGRTVIDHKTTPQSSDPTRIATLEKQVEILSAWFARRVKVEQALFDAANGKSALPDAQKCRALALQLGVPDEFRASEDSKVRTTLLIAPSLVTLLPTNDARSAMHAGLQIGDGSFHVEAYEVTMDADQRPVAVDPAYAMELEDVASLTGGNPTTVTIDGRQFVVVIFPHAE
jgi:hypothetical protein